MSRVFSGVQPTGNLHLGNYLGAITHWVKLQKTHDCLFSIVDLHAITVPQDPAHLRQSTRELAAAYIACGIDPNKNALYAQSSVAGHAELAWLLSCHTPLGWLNRMTQFKEKAGKKRDQAVLGLYSYPVLMAADILLFQSTHVPVGEDQKQHLELARDIAGAFNRYYKQEFFTLPEPLILGQATRVMSLRDGTKKMSKSDVSEYSRIHLTDNADVIATKIKKAKSDAIEGISFDPESRPETSNLMTIYAAITDVSIESVASQFASSGFGEFKQALADALIARICPIGSEMQHLLKDTAHLDSILQQGTNKASDIAAKTLHDVKKMIGFVV